MYLQDALNCFPSISLAELNSRAELMQRSDNKYVLTRQELLEFLENLQSDFHILEIEERTLFSYSSQYWDSPELKTFFDHNQERRKRYKIRFRTYLDTGLCFFEVKIKGLRGATHKYRTVIDPSLFQCTELPQELLDFLNEKLTLHYGTTLNVPLIPSISVDYERFTLVANESQERITVDSNLRFESSTSFHELPNDRHVVEVKSASGRASADKMLLRQSIRPRKKCSKYGIGINTIKLPAKRRTSFSPVIKQCFSPRQIP